MQGRVVLSHPRTFERYHHLDARGADIHLRSARPRTAEHDKHQKQGRRSRRTSHAGFHERTAYACIGVIAIPLKNTSPQEMGLGYAVTLSSSFATLLS
jgi:hypothetical protein